MVVDLSPYTEKREVIEELTGLVKDLTDPTDSNEGYKLVSASAPVTIGYLFQLYPKIMAEAGKLVGVDDEVISVLKMNGSNHTSYKQRFVETLVLYSKEHDLKRELESRFSPDGLESRVYRVPTGIERQ